MTEADKYTREVLERLAASFGVTYVDIAGQYEAMMAPIVDDRVITLSKVEVVDAHAVLRAHLEGYGAAYQMARALGVTRGRISHIKKGAPLTAAELGYLGLERVVIRKKGRAR